MITLIENYCNEMDTARITRGKTATEVQPFRNEGMPFGMANSKSQIPDMKSEICNLKFRASARIKGYTSINRVL